MSERREAAEALFEGRLADRIQNQVNASAIGQSHRLLGEIADFVVDHFIGSEIEHQLLLAVARNRSDHPCAACLGDLYRGNADPSRGRMYDYRLRRGQTMAGMNRVPRRQHRDWECRSFLETEVIRQNHHTASSNQS